MFDIGRMMMGWQCCGICSTPVECLQQHSCTKGMLASVPTPSHEATGPVDVPFSSVEDVQHLLDHGGYDMGGNGSLVDKNRLKGAAHAFRAALGREQALRDEADRQVKVKNALACLAAKRFNEIVQLNHKFTDAQASEPDAEVLCALVIGRFVFTVQKALDEGWRCKNDKLHSGFGFVLDHLGWGFITGKLLWMFSVK